MQQLPHRAQRLSLIAFFLPSQHHNPVAAPAQGIIVPICGRGVCAANR